MPGQFQHLCLHLRNEGHKIIFISKKNGNLIHSILDARYELSRPPSKQIHHYLRTFEDNILHGQAVFRMLQKILAEGNKPDFIIGHSGWGETLFIRDILPNVPILNYWEFFYNPTGQDLDFDPEFRVGVDGVLARRVSNAATLITWAASKWGITPTKWQLSTYPAEMQANISVIHDGIDTETVRPNSLTTFALKDGRVLKFGSKVVTFISRSLEPPRGFHIFMRAISAIQRRHPDADFLIVGGDGISYGAPLPNGETYKARLLKESDIDLSRVHFTGHVHTPVLRAIMRISMVHVYLTYPLVLSWSVLEAMASECLVIGSRTAPVQEVIVDGENGFLVDFFDKEALIEKIDEVLLNPALILTSEDWLVNQS